jgi:hypothetical protein
VLDLCFHYLIKQFLKEMFLDQLHEVKNSHKIEPCTASEVALTFLEPLRANL